MLKWLGCRERLQQYLSSIQNIIALFVCAPQQVEKYLPGFNAAVNYGKFSAGGVFLLCAILFQHLRLVVVCEDAVRVPL